MPSPPESAQRIEPCRLDALTPELSDLVTHIVSQTATLESALHPRSAQSLADLVRLMNSYYSNLIEGHDTRPRDIERALVAEFVDDEARRSLQFEALAHVRLQQAIDRRFAQGELREPAVREEIRWLHREFYRGAHPSMLRIESKTGAFDMAPGEFRSEPVHDNVVGRHLPPGSARVPEFMAYFEERFRFAEMGRTSRIVAVAIAHHRFNYIHPFPDGNGRVSRLLSHAMALGAGIGAHGLWSISRGLARGLGDRSEYKRRMDAADEARRGDLDGRGNLSLSALTGFVEWFFRVIIDQLEYMSSAFELSSLQERVTRYVERDLRLRHEAAVLASEILARGEIPRGQASGITGLKERTARSVLQQLTEAGLVASDTAKGPVSFRFPVAAAEVLFPRLFG